MKSTSDTKNIEKHFEAINGTYVVNRKFLALSPIYFHKSTRIFKKRNVKTQDSRAPEKISKVIPKTEKYLVYSLLISNISEITNHSHLYSGNDGDENNH